MVRARNDKSLSGREMETSVTTPMLITHSCLLARRRWPMSTHESQLKNELQTLQETFRELSLRLAETAGNLGRSGRPPSEEIIQQLEGAHRRFRELQEGAFQLAAGEHMAAPTVSDRATIPDLLALLRQVDETRTIRQKKQEQLQKARSVLDRVFPLVHTNSASFAPLADL